MHPILFEVGPFVIGSYGAFVLLGLLAGWYLLPRYARRAAIDPKTGRELLVLIFAAGWIGCRLLGAVLRFDDVLAEPKLMLWIFQQAGVWYGALIAGGATGILLARRWKLNGWAVLDMAAVPAAVGGGIGRIGCLMSGCCHGRPTDLPWAVTYTDPAARALHPGLPAGPVHPAVLYEFFAVLAMAAFLDRYGRKERETGQVGLVWIILYGVIRMVVEVFRGDAIRGSVAGILSTSQVISLAAVLAASAALALRRPVRP